MDKMATSSISRLGPTRLSAGRVATPFTTRKKSGLWKKKFDLLICKENTSTKMKVTD